MKTITANESRLIEERKKLTMYISALENQLNTLKAHRQDIDNKLCEIMENGNER